MSRDIIRLFLFFSCGAEREIFLKFKTNKQMVGGNLIDYFKRTDFQESVHTFLLKEEKTGNTCCVSVDIPENIVKEVKIGDIIWWHNPDVYFQILGSKDVPFKKIGPSGGDAGEFYTQKLEHERTRNGGG